MLQVGAKYSTYDLIRDVIRSHAWVRHG